MIELGGVEKGGANQRFKERGILGYYTNSSHSAQSTREPRITGESLQTALPVSTIIEHGLELATTGNIYKLPQGGAAIITGRPYFLDAQLDEIARSQGHATALGIGYEKYSSEIFAHLFGAFSCAIVDSSINLVLAGIDRFGQHSLYYRANDSGIGFGSCAEGFLACDQDVAELLEQGIYNYLYFHMVPCEGSIYRGIKKVPGAHYLEYHNGQCRLLNYWQPTFSESKKDQSFDELSRQLKDTLHTAVEKCLVDAGKVGSFLSGGLDSSTVTGVMAELAQQKAAAYSIGFSAEGYDEMAYARITAHHFGVELNEYYVTPQDVVDALPMIATSYDEPFGNSSALPAYFCAKMAVENGVTTLLAGDGGDEIFGGNERYTQQRVFEHYAKVPGFLRTGLIEPLAKTLPLWLPLISKARSYITQANTPLPDRMQSYNFLHRHPASEIFSNDFLRLVDETAPLALLRSIYQRPLHASDLNRMLYLDWQITLADNDLRKVSHMCALAGVEVAYPMLDDALVELSCKIPSTWKIEGGKLRHFYKQALKDWLPRETISKTKQGFGLPFGVWMKSYNPLRELAYDNLLKLKSRGLIRPEFIDKAITMHQSEHAAYYGELVWILTVFELWLSSHSNVRM